MPSVSLMRSATRVLRRIIDAPLAAWEPAVGTTVRQTNGCETSGSNLLMQILTLPAPAGALTGRHDASPFPACRCLRHGRPNF